MIQHIERKCGVQEHNSILPKYKVIALCYFFLSGELLKNQQMESNKTSNNVRAQ